MQFTETIPHHLYQIYFDEISRKNLDPGFLPLDNSKNERPDWREYWPIRQFLIKESLNENALYGFLSHKFFQKTLDIFECIFHSQKFCQKGRRLQCTWFHYQLKKVY